MIRKIQDTFNDGRSDADKYFWETERRRFYKLFRNKVADLPKGFASNAENSVITTKEFSLKGIQFGNWLSTEDKFNYLSSFWIGMNDLQSIIRFNKKNLGLNQRLGVAFGSRGVANSKAHFSPTTNVININRYMDETSVDKITRFLHSGGAGSMAHEYGHFIDAAYGSQIERMKEFYFLSDSATGVRKHKPITIDPKEFPMRYQMAVIFEKILFKKDRKGVFKPTRYGQSLASIKSIEGGDYYRKTAEIWARLFEVYISFKLSKKGLQNSFLTKTQGFINASTRIYLNTSEIKAITPDIDKLLSMIRKQS